MFKLTWSTTKAPWLSHPETRWNNGLVEAGKAWRNSLQRSYYGNSVSGGPMTYQRTGNLGNKSNFRVTIEGREMDLLSTHYLPYLVLGTGLYGPRRSPITPKHASLLRWKATANFGFSIGASGNVKSAGRGMEFVAKSVRGTIWPGKKDQLLSAMHEGFVQGVRSGTR